MSNEELESLCSRISYKPHSKVWVMPTYGDAVSIHVSHRVLDSNNSDEWIPVRTSDVFHSKEIPLWTEADAKAVIYLLFRRLEMHEVDEWMRVDGVRYREPHPEQRKV